MQTALRGSEGDGDDDVVTTPPPPPPHIPHKSMEHTTPQPAEADDVDPLIELLSNAVPQCSPVTVWSIPWTWEQYQIVPNEDGRPVACGGLLDLDDGRSEIRGLVVDPEYRGRGLARAIVHRLIDIAGERDRTAVCVTKNPAFFERFGFHMTQPSWLELRLRSVQSPEPRYAMTRASTANVIPLPRVA